ncbi:MAG: hypothetical protein J6589_07655 [Snodgrassella sp.]|uniref:hypothetical protein n=1 Tax=Snodgrassella sp. TaxID=2815304 RepID=UPI002585F965|nr:hypothetical protein [Snodgrassella sp.]MCO6514326.1 hypothetical protein [Snodgrassella sp.]MCO6520523.1 hypothetical protein [Snodgrassella sp.]
MNADLFGTSELIEHFISIGDYQGAQWIALVQSAYFKGIKGVFNEFKDIVTDDTDIEELKKRIAKLTDFLTEVNIQLAITEKYLNETKAVLRGENPKRVVI